MKLRLVEEAERSLEAIGEWIARDDPAAAHRVMLEIRQACAELPERATLYPFASGGSELRRRLFGKYLIYYHVVGDTLEVIDIVHGARDQSRWR